MVLVGVPLALIYLAPVREAALDGLKGVVDDVRSPTTTTTLPTIEIP